MANKQSLGPYGNIPGGDSFGPWGNVPIVSAPGAYDSGEQPVQNIPLKGRVYQENVPVAKAVVNSVVLRVSEYTITWNAHGILDTCDFTVPIYGNPDFTQTLLQNSTDTSAIAASLYTGFPTNPIGNYEVTQLSPRFVGQLDQYTIDHLTGTIKFQCRSLGAYLGDTRITTPVAYQTSAQLITAECKKINLATNIQIAGAPIQLAEVFQREFVAGVKNFRVWDLILQCAQYDDADVFVDGDTLYYVAPYLLDASRNKVNLAIGQDLENCTAIHAPQYNRKIRVEVRSYIPATRTGTLTRIQTLSDGTVVQSVISKTATSSPIFGTTGVVTTGYAYNQSTGTYTKATGVSYKSGGTFSSSTSEIASTGLERYVIYVAGIDAQKNVDRARALWRQISMHEWNVTLDLPIRKDLYPVINRFALINLSGSPYALVNAKYWPRRITESSSVTSGAKWMIECVNHAPPLGEGTV